MADQALKDRIAANRAKRFADGGDIPSDPQTQAGLSLDPEHGQKTATAVSNQLDSANAQYLDAQSKAKQGDYSGLDDLASTAALSTIGATQEAPNGLLQQARQAVGHPSAIGYMDQLPMAQKLVQDTQAAVAAGVLTPDHLAAAESNLRTAMNNADRLKAQRGRKGYAEGGDVAPEDGVLEQDRSPASLPLPAGSPQGAAPGVNVINPEGQLVSIPQDTLEDAIGMGYSPASPEHVSQYAKEQKYGSAGQQIKAGLEGIAQGVAGPAATAVEVGTGLARPEDIRGREEVNPGTHLLGETAGFVGGTFTGASEANLLEHAGAAAAERAGFKAGGSFVNQVGQNAVKSAFETALYQGGEELSKKFKEDPEQTAGSALADIGLAGVMGGVFGGALGAALKKPAEGLVPEGKLVSELDQPLLDAGDLKTSIQHSDIPEARKESWLSGLLDKSEKAEAPEIRKASARLGIEPLEGMVSDNKFVQQAEDSLINKVPTYSGLKRTKLYNDVYAKAAGAADEALGEQSRYTKAELGDIFKQSLTSQIKEENAPISEMYQQLKGAHGVIPVSEEAAPRISEELMKLPEVKVTSRSPEAKLANDIIAELGNVKTVDDLKVLKTSVNKRLPPTATSGERHMAAVLSDRLKELEEDSVEKFAKSAARTPEETAAAAGLKDARKAADAEYRPFITKVQKLAQQLGKRRVYGPADAIHFIQETLTPEQVTSRLFSKNSSDFLKFFAKEFPEQHALMQEYQKGVLREAAAKSGEFSPKVLFNSVNKLEPEIQKSIFNSAELQRIKDAETVIRSLPKNFNPSGTAGASAFREFFQHPTGAAVGNARDFAIERFIKSVGHSPEAQQAISLAKSTVAGERLSQRAVKAVFNTAKDSMPAAVIPLAAHTEKLAKLVNLYAAHPEKLLATGDNNPVPEYAQSFSSTSARAVQYLASLRPDTEKKNPLDGKMPATAFQKAAYERALQTAQQPLNVLARIKNGTLTPQDINTLKTIYPKTYQSLSTQLMSGVMDTANKGESVPYQTRLQLAMFLGQPLDSTMTPSAIMSVQSQAAVKQQQAQQEAPKHSTSKLSGIAKSAQTQGQGRQAARSGQQKD